MKTARIWSILVLALGLMLWPAETTKGDAEWTRGTGRVWNTTLTDFIGIGTTTPSAKLHVYGGNLMAEKEGGTVSFYGRVFSNGYHSPATYFYRARGSKAAPAGILNGDPIGFFGFVGRHPTGWSTSAAFFQARADATWTSTSYPTHMLFATCPSGSTAATPRMLIDSTGYVGIGTGTLSPAARLHITEPSTSTPALRYDRGAAVQAQIGPWAGGSYGAYMNLYSEDGYYQFRLEPDGNGQGGYFAVYRTNTSSGFVVDGNAGTGTGVYIYGPYSSYFNTGVTGNSSVQLPSNAIYDYEILDEPGAASSTYSGGAITLSKTSATIMRSRSLTCPTSGYVLVIGSAVVAPWHIYGIDTWGRIGVSDIASLSGWPANQQMEVRIPNTSVGLRWYNHPVTVHGLFSVGAGTRTFYLLGHQPSGAASSSVQAYDFQLTCVFIPTAYGSIMPTDLVPAGPADPLESIVPGPIVADVAAEQVEAEAFNAARLQAELDEMRAEIEALRQEIQETNTPSESEE